MPPIAIKLEPFDFEIVTVTPVVDGIAQLGLIDKYNSLAGVSDTRVEKSNLNSTFKCCGQAGFFFENRHLKNIDISSKGKAGGFSTIEEESVQGQVQGSVILVTLDPYDDNLEVAMMLK